MILRELLAKFGVEYDNAGAKKADKDVSGLATAAKEMIGIIGGAAAIRGFGNFILGQVEMADAIGDTAERIGIGVGALQELRYAAAGAGLGAEQVDAALGKMGRGAADAAKGQGAAKDAFAELGVQLTDSSGNLRSLDDVVMQVSEGLARVPNESDRARLGLDIFGREGSKFTETLKGGSTELEAMREQARALGGVLSKEQVDAADKADKALIDFRFALQGVKNEISARFIPALTRGVGWLMDWVTAAQTLVRSSYIIEAALITAGAALVAFVGGARLLMITKAGIAFAVVALAIESIIKTAQGGDTALGRFIDSMQGKGATLVWIENWKAGFKILVENAQELAKQLGAAWTAMEKLNAEADRRKQDEEQPWRKGGIGAQAEYEAAHREWEERKKLLESYPEWYRASLGLLGRGLGPEPLPPGASTTETSTPFNVLRERGTTTERSYVPGGYGGGRGPLLPEVMGESPAERATATRARGARFAAAEAAKLKGGGATPPVVVNQTNTVTVTANGLDANEVARKTATEIRKDQQRGNKQALRSVRQVAR